MAKKDTELGEVAEIDAEEEEVLERMPPWFRALREAYIERERKRIARKASKKVLGDSPLD